MSASNGFGYLVKEEQTDPLFIPNEEHAPVKVEPVVTLVSIKREDENVGHVEDNKDTKLEFCEEIKQECVLNEHVKQETSFQCFTNNLEESQQEQLNINNVKIENYKKEDRVIGDIKRELTLEVQEEYKYEDYKYNIDIEEHKLEYSSDNDHTVISETGERVQDTTVDKTPHASVVKEPEHNSSSEDESLEDILEDIQKSRRIVIECKICKIEFQTFECLIEHNMKLHADNPSYCNICSKVFSEEAALKAHEISEHNFKLHAGNLINTCPVCSSTVFHPYFIKHLTAHRCFCITCFKDFGDVEGLREHKRMSHEETVLCTQCGLVVRLSAYNSHLKYHETEPERPIPEPVKKIHEPVKRVHEPVRVICPNPFEEENNISSNKENKCNVCEEIFTNKRDLSKHINCLHSEPYSAICEVCGKFFRSQSGLTSHKEIHEERVYDCAECGRTFKVKRSLQYHLDNNRCFMKKHRTHVNIDIQCERCGKCFNGRSALVSHIKTHGPKNLQKYVCEICGRSFNHRTVLRDHRFSHQAVKPYKCDYCDKTFVNKVGKENHVRGVHTGERPFVCEYCGKSYFAQKNLQVHVTVHISSKTYKCKFCGEVFPNIPRRNCHMKIHF